MTLACLLAPLYASAVAHADPFASNISGTTVVDGVTVPVLAASDTGLGLGVTPIGPTWDPAHYFLGSDNQGRDVMGRLLYGGRDSLLIGFSARAAVLRAGHGRPGWPPGTSAGSSDAVLARVLDVLWAFPVYLLAICMSVVLLTAGVTIGPGDDRPRAAWWLPVIIIALVYVPYVARPLRGQVIALKEKEFVSAAVGVGASDLRIMRRDVLPNVLPTGGGVPPPDDGARDAHRIGAELPVRRCPAPGGQLGNDHQRRSGPALHPARRSASPRASPSR